MWSRVFLLALILQAAVALLLRKKDCPQPCIPIDKCPDLIKLIRTNVRAVQEATCGFQQDSTPLVSRLHLPPKVCCLAFPKTPLDLRFASSSTPSTTTTTTSKPLISTPSTTTTTTSKPSISTTIATTRELSSENPLLPQMCNEHYSEYSPTFFQSSLLDHRIHGGQTLLHPSYYPWMAALGFRNAFTDKIDFLCGGSVINERYLLTAAHCFKRQLEVVRLGEYDLTSEIDCEISPTGFVFCASEPAQDFDFEEIIEHPDFGKRGLFSDDIALVRLASPITFSLKGSRT
ncbi:CLIP domain-containing serine protease B9-like [Eriocheir sinensis]|uniref:CLIP domain-containing serine protease B9-like n=1 Tax=Eriocheir sinensis TaxID=95602 RepID=UPI0021C66FEF|nr:CLIP domain-containing serine protease B9-like [Eriocheir sinensis]